MEVGNIVTVGEGIAVAVNVDGIGDDEAVGVAVVSISGCELPKQAVSANEKNIKIKRVLYMS